MIEALWLVAIASLLIGVTAGFFMHRSDFCLAGTFRDFFLFRSVDRLGALLLLITFSAAAFEAMRLTGRLPGYPFPWFQTPSLSNIFGGVIFGIGMVMAGGCVVGVLYKFGSGSLLAGVAILGLIIGSGLYAEIHTLWSPLARAMQLPSGVVTLPQQMALSPTGLISVFVLLGAVISWKWWQAYRHKAKNRADGYIPLPTTALILAVLGLASVMTTTIPLGVSTSYTKAAALVEDLVIPEHVAETAFFTARNVHLTVPLSGERVTGGGGPQFDAVALVQYPLIFGIVFGSLLSAKLLGEFRIYWRVPGHQVLLALSGGIIMALGSRLAPGCNVWHLLGGLPILAMQSLLFVAGMIPGAWLGTQIVRRILI